MNVLRKSTIAITTPHAKILMVHLLALVILGIQEMGLIVKVSSCYFKRWYDTEKSRIFFSHCKTHIAAWDLAHIECI